MEICQMGKRYYISKCSSVPHNSKKLKKNDTWYVHKICHTVTRMSQFRLYAITRMNFTNMILSEKGNKKYVHTRIPIIWSLNTSKTNIAFEVWRVVYFGEGVMMTKRNWGLLLNWLCSIAWPGCLWAQWICDHSLSCTFMTHAFFCMIVILY